MGDGGDGEKIGKSKYKQEHGTSCNDTPGDVHGIIITDAMFSFEMMEYTSHFSQVLPDNLHNVHNNHNSGGSLLCSSYFGGLGLPKISKGQNLSIGGCYQGQSGFELR